MYVLQICVLNFSKYYLYKMFDSILVDQYFAYIPTQSFFLFWYFKINSEIFFIVSSMSTSSEPHGINSLPKHDQAKYYLTLFTYSRNLVYINNFKISFFCKGLYDKSGKSVDLIFHNPLNF